MNPQSTGSAGPQGFADVRGGSQQAGFTSSSPQPEPEYIYELPEDYLTKEDSARVGHTTSAAGNTTSAGSPHATPATAGSNAQKSVQPPLPGMSAEDFEKLCRTVDKAFSQFAKVVEKGIDEAPAVARGVSQAASSVAQRAQAQAGAWSDQRRQSPQQPRGRAQMPWSGGKGVRPNQNQLQNREIALANSRFRPTTSLTVSGIVMTVAGAVGVLAFGTVASVGVAIGLAADSAGVAAAAMMGAAALGFAALLGFGIDNLRVASYLKTLRHVVGNLEACSFDDIASRAQISRAKAVARVRKLLKRGLIPQGRIDDQGTTLMVTDNAYAQYRQLRQSHLRTLEEQRRAEQARAADQALRNAREKDLADRLTPAERAFIVEGRDFQRQMRDLDERIADVEVSERIVAIESVVGRILDRAEKEPSVIAGIDRLTTYYLPTAVKLLTAYESLEDQPVQGDNISSSRREIEKTLEVLRLAFEKLLDDTYQDLSLDVSADITVLHSVLAQEGLAEGPFNVKP